MDGRQAVTRRRWADTVVIVTSLFVLVWSIWLYPDAGSHMREGTLWAVHALGGTLGIASVFLALRSTTIGRVVLAAGGLVLLFGTFASFRSLTAGAIITVLVPALILLGMVPFLGPMPTPEQEGESR